MKKNFLMSGTLGDAFIVMLKLYKNYKNEKINLRRISKWPDQDEAIFKLSKLFKFIRYKKPCFNIQHVDDTIELIKKLDYFYVNTSWNGSHFKNAEKDFKNLKAEPYPKLNLKNLKIKKKKKIICIQVNTGKVGGNCKIFSHVWIYNLLNLLKTNNYRIILVGTILDNPKYFLDNYKNDKNIKLLINKTRFNEWLNIIRTSDMFISMEGFPAFFSMSQKVKTICFYTDRRILTRIHPIWKKENYIRSVGWKSFYSTIKVIIARYLLKRYPLIYPIEPEKLIKYINNKLK